MNPTAQLQFSDNPGEARYEASLNGELAGFAAYRQKASTLTVTHTEVLPAHEGHGVGSALAKFLLDDLRGRGLKLVPACQFIAAYIQRHSEYADLVA